MPVKSFCWMINNGSGAYGPLMKALALFGSIANVMNWALRVTADLWKPLPLITKSLAKDNEMEIF